MKFHEKLQSLLISGSDIQISDGDHNYFKQTSSEYVLAYTADFIAWKAKKFIKCSSCKQELSHNGAEKNYFNFRNRKKKIHLTKPLHELHRLISIIEQSVLDVVSNGSIHRNTLFDIMDKVQERNECFCIGCGINTNMYFESFQRTLEYGKAI